MKEIHFYANKTSNLLLFIISTLFCFAFIYFYDDLQNEISLKVIVLHLTFMLFLFIFVVSFLLLIRRKPLLTITDVQIISYNILRKNNTVNFKDISKFYISKNTFRGIKTTEYIYIVLNNSKEKKSLFLLDQQNIQVDILNVKATDLLKILNDRLKYA
ncbi:STM3941 family protein [Chryseobacterium sp. C39-AII1]|uniref:STM3941 family protein n=1 Tax=Chryseobacterium sp. C39-AII1 TaxID=3080332 RepID=UPI00320A38D8